MNIDIESITDILKLRPNNKFYDFDFEIFINKFLMASQKYKKIYIFSNAADDLTLNSVLVTCNNESQKFYINAYLKYSLSELYQCKDMVQNDINALEDIRKSNEPELGGIRASLEEEYKLRMTDLFDQLVGIKRAISVVSNKLTFDFVKIEVV